MNRAQYLEYIAHFNNRRYEAVTSYFSPDVTVEYYDDATYNTPARTLYGRDQFMSNYRSLHEHTREILELRDFMAYDNLVFAELYTEFHTFANPPSGSGRNFKEGDIRIMTNWVIYNMEDGKMKRIRIAHFRMHDPKLAKFSAKD